MADRPRTRKVSADSGGGKESPVFIGRAVVKTKKTEKDQDSKGGTDKLSTPVDTGKSADSKGGTDALSTPVNTGTSATTQSSPPPSATSKYSTSSAADYEHLSDEEQANMRIVTVYSLYHGKLNQREYVPFMVSFKDKQIKDICIDFPPTEEFGDSEASLYRINSLDDFNADDGYFPLVLLQMMCLVDDLPRQYLSQIDETFPAREYPGKNVSRFSGQLAEMLITSRQNCDSGLHPNMDRSTSPNEPATTAQLEELGILCRGYHAVVHHIQLTAGSNEKKNAQDRNDSVNREAAHKLETHRNEMETALTNALDPATPFFNEDQQKLGPNITEEQVYKLGHELDKAHKFDGTRLPAHSIAYFTPGYLASKLGGTGTTTLHRVYSQNSLPEPRKPGRKRGGYATLDDQKSISSQQFSSDRKEVYFRSRARKFL